MEYIEKLAKQYKLNKLSDPKHLKTISVSAVIVVLLICILITTGYATLIWLVPDLKHTLTLGLFN